MSDVTALDRVVTATCPRDVVVISGPDAEAYLQGQVSADVAALAQGESALSFLLTPRGRIEAAFAITRVAADTFFADTDVGYGEAISSSLERFKLRMKVAIAPQQRTMHAVRGAMPSAASVPGSILGSSATSMPSAAAGVLTSGMTSGMTSAMTSGTTSTVLSAEADARGDEAGDGAGDAAGDDAADRLGHGAGRGAGDHAGHGSDNDAGAVLVRAAHWPGAGGHDVLVRPGSGSDSGAVGVPAEAERLSADEFDALRMAFGLPAMGIEIQPGDIPNETGLVERAASFTKGCYRGQELVERIDSRAGGRRTIRRLRTSRAVSPGDRLVGRDGSTGGSSDGSTGGSSDGSTGGATSIGTVLSARTLADEFVGFAKVQRDAASEVWTESGSAVSLFDLW
ncbi:YgfZ/GcvT domain-containing protein [Candidatus Poriferisodalis sp.]|uniref:YgfZ/GcvT domain-containing protein n=1 Tax=Candidatus Poriferisodalis sp. TaxID=3101277 RepID=UPI003B02E19A